MSTIVELIFEHTLFNTMTYPSLTVNHVINHSRWVGKLHTFLYNATSFNYMVTWFFTSSAHDLRFCSIHDDKDGKISRIMRWHYMKPCLHKYEWMERPKQKYLAYNFIMLIIWEHHLRPVWVFIQDWAENPVGFMDWAIHLSIALYQPNITQPKSYWKKKRSSKSSFISFPFCSLKA